MNLKYGLLQGFYWAAFCCIFSFYVPLFQSFGYDTLTIGFISMCAPATLALAQPIWGILCDRSKRIKPILALALIGGVVGSLILPLGKTSIVYTLLAVIILASSIQSLMYIFDTWSIRLKNDGANISFGITRSFGSAFYAITGALFGAALDRFGMGIITPVFIVLIGIVIVLTFSIKEPQTFRPAASDKENFKVGIKKLSKNKAYISLLISLFFIFFGSTGSALFLALRISDLGGGNSEYGLALFIMAMFEIPTLLLYKKLALKFSNRTLLCISMFFKTLKISGIALSPYVWMVVAVQCLQAPSYGIYLSAIANYVPEIVERQTVFTAQTVIAAIVAGLAGICSNLFMGTMTTYVGLEKALRILIAFPVTGFVIFALSSVLLKSPEKSHRS